MKARVCSETDLFKALGDRTRHLIVEILLDGERCACELPRLARRAQPTVSLQLKYLSKEGILSSRREGRRVIYSVADCRVHDLFKALGHRQALCMRKNCCLAK